MYIRKVKKSESKSQLELAKVKTNRGLCISVKLKNLKANHNPKEWVFYVDALCISVKLKNLKANHNRL